jgi:hypothetical protein
MNWYTILFVDGGVFHTDNDFDARDIRREVKNGLRNDVLRVVRGRVYQTLSGAIVE